MIREAIDVDLLEISKILKEVHILHQTNRTDIFKDLIEPINMDYYRKLLSDETSKIYIIIEDNIIAGYMTLKISDLSNHPVLRDQKIIKMEDLAILRKYHDKGLGSQLFDKALQYASDEDANKMELHVWNFNDKAKEFYLNKGMKFKSQNLEIYTK